MSTPYELTGIVKIIGQIQSFASGFQKREIVITTDEKYPQDVKIDFVKEGCDRLEAFQVGDTATIFFNVRGNEYQGKHYVSLQGWKIEGDGSTGHRQQPTPARSASQNGAPPPSTTATADSLDFDEDDDIAF